MSLLKIFSLTEIIDANRSLLIKDSVFKKKVFIKRKEVMNRINKILVKNESYRREFRIDNKCLRNLVINDVKFRTALRKRDKSITY